MSIKVLCVCREIPSKIEIHGYPVAEFVYEQNQHLKALNVEIDYYLIRKSGALNYLREVFRFRNYLQRNHDQYDIIHAHGGHIGSLTNLQRKVPVITTYHGSDINYLSNRIYSFLSLILSKKNIFVSLKLLKMVRRSFKNTVIPCGVDFNVFHPLDKKFCRDKLGINCKEKLIVFAGNSEVKIKNYPLALEAIKLLNKSVRLIELKGYSRQEVNLLLNAADLLLLTSFSEGSPQAIKEAMACNCPIVATDVGDITEIVDGTDGCFITSFEPEDVAKKIELALEINGRTKAREKIKHIDNKFIAEEVYRVYKQTVVE